MCSKLLPSKLYRIPAQPHSPTSGWFLLPSLAEAIAPPFPHPETLRPVGLQHYLQHQFAEAIATFQALLQHHEATGNVLGAIDTLNLMGLAACEIKEFTQALGWCRQALSLSELHPATATHGHTLINLGFIYVRQKQGDHALPYFKAALQAAQQAQDAIGVGSALNNLAIVYGMQGEAARSHPLILASLAVFQQSNQQAEEAVVYYNGGESVVEEEPLLALTYWRRASAIWTALGDFVGEAIAFQSMGDVHQHLGQPFHALSCYQEALELQRSVGNWAAEASLIEQIAEVYQVEGMPLSALDQLHRSLAVYQFIGDRAATDRLLCRLGKLYESLDELAAAMECYQQVLGQPTDQSSIPANTGVPMANLSNLLFHSSCPIAS